MFTDTAGPAVLTALHLALATLRRHRAPGRPLLSPFVGWAYLFVVAPSIWPTPTGLALGALVHVAWFVVCEWLSPAPARAARPAMAAAAPPRPAVAPKPAPSFATTSVLAVLDETPDIKTFRLARPDGFTFLAGQFLAVRVMIEGKPHVRCYSISSAPDTRGYLEISVRRQGLVSGMLHATVRAGSTLTVMRPAGQFVYPGDDDRPLALIAGGVGITPLLSMLRHGVASDPSRPITLLYSARREADVAFKHELHVLAERHPQVRIAVTLTQPAGPTRLRTGRVDQSLLTQYIASPAHTLFCLCGPGAMIEGLRDLLRALGVPAAQVRYEQFETAVAASQVNPAAQGDPAAPVAAGAVRVTFASSGRSTSAPSSQTLLETAESEGVDIISSCRAGVCQSCRTRLTSGNADCRSDMLDPEDRAAGFILPCVTWPQGDCVLDA